MKTENSKYEMIPVALAERSYNILLGEDIFDIIPGQLKKLKINKQLAVISVPPVSELYYERLKEQLHTDFDVFHFDVPDGEQSKSAGVVTQLYDWLLENKIERLLAKREKGFMAADIIYNRDGQDASECAEKIKYLIK